MIRLGRAEAMAERDEKGRSESGVESERRKESEG
jgi:hypothetical protein